MYALTEDEEVWREYALCSGSLTGFIPDNNSNGPERNYAKRICKDCPVRTYCARQIIAYKDEFDRIGDDREDRNIRFVIIGLWAGVYVSRRDWQPKRATNSKWQRLQAIANGDRTLLDSQTVVMLS